MRLARPFKKIYKHEKSTPYLDACCISDLWRSDKTVYASMKSQLKNETNNKLGFSVLDLRVNVTLTLAASNLAFRGHPEIVGQPNSVNF